MTGTGTVDGTIISYKLQYQLSSIVRRGNGHGLYPMLLSPRVEGKWLRDLPRGLGKLRHLLRLNTACTTKMDNSYIISSISGMSAWMFVHVFH